MSSKVKHVIAYHKFHNSEAVVTIARTDGRVRQYRPGENTSLLLQKAVSNKVFYGDWTMMPTTCVGLGYVAFPSDSGVQNAR